MAIIQPPPKVQGYARNPIVATLGDSRTEYNWGSAGRLMRPVGFAYWTQVALGSRVSFPSGLNFGVAGDTTTQMLARLGACAASAADFVVVFGGTNDRTAVSPVMTAADTIANLSTMIGALRGAGKVVFLICELPRGDSTFSSKRLPTNDLAAHMQVAQWCRDQRFTRGVYPVDLWPEMCLSSSTTGDIAAGFSYDALHMNQVGAKAIGDKLAVAIASVSPTVANDTCSTNSDVFVATYHPYGSLTPNPMLTGTGGALNTGVTGAVADSLIVTAAPSGLAYACSKVTVGTKVWQQVVISGTPAASATLDILRLDSALVGSINANDVLYGTSEVEIDAGGSGYQSLQFGTRTTHTTAGTIVTQMGDPDPAIAPPNVAMAGFFISPPHVIPNESTITARLKYYITVANGVAVSLTFRARAMALRKVRP